LVDLLSGAGGAAVGYHRPGFEVGGVDIRPQPRYPFEHRVADALTFPLDGFDAVHASPPCQAYSIARNIHGSGGKHPRLIEPTRERLAASGLPYVIENVPGAPLLSPLLVCGLSLGLGVKRHRLFESNVFMLGMPCGAHRGDWLLVFGHTVLDRGHVVGKAKGGGNTIRRRHVGTERGRVAMGIDWMNRGELSEAVPPAYTEFVGGQLLDAMRSEVPA